MFKYLVPTVPLRKLDKAITHLGKFLPKKKRLAYYKDFPNCFKILIFSKIHAYNSPSYISHSLKGILKLLRSFVSGFKSGLLKVT
jgi:hypothetical protein